MPTGVRSLLSSSVADAAASSRSAHFLSPAKAAMFEGSADNAFLSWACLLSFERCLSCFAFRAFSVMEDFRGLDGLGFGKGCKLVARLEDW